MNPFPSSPRFIGRAAQQSPPNRFEKLHCEADDEHLSWEEANTAADPQRVPTEFLPDEAKTILRENNSPDIPFRWSLNPYRGCEHGCAYCYARPGHETLGMNAGLDFETKILVKHDAPRLLRAELNRPGWAAEVIVMSGVTDCYQPAERRFRLTRACLEVLWEARQPVGFVTKNALILRDLDLLKPLAENHLVNISVSLTTLDEELARTLEPRTATPSARLRTIKELATAGVPVRVMAAPMIPGLNDRELPAILEAAKEAGARDAGYTLLRLPLSVEPVFTAWLRQNRPDEAERIIARIRHTRGGRMNDSQFGSRFRGEGAYAEQIAQNFRVFRTKFGLTGPLPPLDSSQFRPPRLEGAQLRMF